MNIVEFAIRRRVTILMLTDRKLDDVHGGWF
jgi:hypothetical protein